MQKKRIMVVEDERIVSMDVQSMLRRLGHEVAATADRAEEAVRLTSELRPDLVLMDIRLGGGDDGIEAAGRIGRLFDIPVVFMTAHSDEETLRRAKLVEPFGYLIKPFDRRGLHTALEMAIYKHAMQSEMRKAMRAAEVANDAKTSFLATVSHELRTPMNGIMGMTELMLLSDLPDEHVENLRLIKESAQALMHVINSILDYNSMEARTLELRETDFRVRELLGDMVDSHRKAAEAKGIELKLVVERDVPAWLKGDAVRLRQALDHLVQNAVKFTPSGAVRVSARQVSPGGGQDDTRLLFSVRDNGPGIPAGRMDEIFDSFTQVENYMTRRQGGLGLGLATCRKLAAIMGGALWAESEQGRGSEFFLTASFRPSARPDLPAEGENSVSVLKGRRILVAEDNRINRLYVTRALEKAGCVVTGVENGSQALKALQKERFDAGVLDIQMPVMDGIEAARAIRNPDMGCRDPEIPLVALTAHALRGDEQRCLAAGLDAYLSKPVESEDILRVLAGLVASR